MRRPLPPASRQHAMTLRQWLILFVLAFAAHILLLSLFRPLPLAISESSKEDRYTLFLEEETAIGKQKDPYGLRYWLRYTEPERLLKPDFESGFSLICRQRESSIPSPDQFHHSLFQSLLPDRSFPEGKIQRRGPAEFVRGAEIPVIPPRTTAKTEAEKIQYPVWTDESGKITGGLFLPDAPSIRLLRREQAKKPMLLRLTLRKDAIPAVEVLRSCGNPKLDMLAVRQLTVRRENFAAGNLPAVKYFTVVWRMPSMKTIRQEKSL